jgi:hypothetical protein
MIIDSHAIIDPRAVVVKPLYTHVASIAMSRSWGPNDEAIRAKLDWIH